MVEVPTVDRVGVLVVADVGQVATKRAELWVEELAHAGLELGLQRVRFAAPFAPVVQRGDDRHLHHHIGIFGGDIRVDVAVAVMADRRLGRFV